eukprot:758097-Hanusia_phi.AAC.1
MKPRKEKKVFNNPVLPPVQERIRQLTMYKWQVHDLRVQYRNEYLQKVEAKRAAQAAKQEELQKEREAKHVEEIKKKQERAKRAYEAMLVLRAEKAKRAMEARQRFEARGELQFVLTGSDHEPLAPYVRQPSQKMRQWSRLPLCNSSGDEGINAEERWWFLETRVLPR